MKSLDITFHKILPLLIGCLTYFFEDTSPFIKDSAILKRYVELQELLNDYAVQVVSR